mgnify:CR=1 FL=1
MLSQYDFCFALVGIIGIITVFGRKSKDIFIHDQDAWPYSVFFIGVALIGLGSVYYHLLPSNERLFWDRLPMSIAFMAFIAAVIADRVHRKSGNTWLLALLVALGILSLLYWIITESQGHGDLRFYAFVQFYPILLLPFLLWLFPEYLYTASRFLGWVIAWYVLSKLLENNDKEVFELLGKTVSGHTLKHLAAAVGAFVIFRMLSTRKLRT